MGEETKKHVPSDSYDEEYFLQRCWGFKEFLRSQGLELTQNMRKCVELSKLEKGMRALDIGCGRGEIIANCAVKGSMSVGIDYSLSALKFSKETIENTTRVFNREFDVHIVRADAKNLPFRDETFNMISISFVVEHLYPPELEKCLNETSRVLSKNGKVIICTSPNSMRLKLYPLWRVLNILLRKKIVPRYNTIYSTEWHVNEQSVLSLRRCLKRAGYKSKIWTEMIDSDSYFIDILLPKKISCLKPFIVHIISLPPLRDVISNTIWAIAKKT